MSTTPSQGYIVEKTFLADAAKFGFDKLDAADRATPPPAFLAKLPAEAKAAVETLREVMAQGEMPYVYRFNPTMVWGFDFKAKGVEVLDADFEGDLSAEVFSMASDGGGNHICLATDGRVVVWNHEESNVEAHTQFKNLDEALWCIMHREAISDEKIAYDDVKQVFASRSEGEENGWSFFRDEIEESL